MRLIFLALLVLGVATTACALAAPVQSTSTPTVPILDTTTPSPNPTASASPQPRLTFVPLGPDRESFPAGVSPLTGLRVQDPATLDLPALLASISNMPVTARPQAGPGFAQWIFELFIGEGTSRFMGVFYGDYPRRIPNVTGSCPVNTTIFDPRGPWVGNRVWLDDNVDGVQDPWEAGVGGVCVDLIDGASGASIAQTSTDSNGYYAFNVESGRQYAIQFKSTDAYSFTARDVGNDDEDSDADPDTGRTPVFGIDAGDRSRDAGLELKSDVPTPTAIPADIAPDRIYVGPIRSGRLTYNHFKDMFPASCLVYASAGKGIRELLEGCEIVYGTDPYSPNTALIDVSHMRELAAKSKIANQPVNYSGALFSETPPDGGQPADSLWMFFHAYTQALWTYDPVSQSYLRQTDDADGKGIFHVATDRLTGRQQSFENVIVIRADYQVVRYLQYDVDLRYGLKGFAYLFRNGQMYKIYWSTENRDWEKQTGLLRPMHFEDANGNLVPLEPGRTWIAVMTLNSHVDDLGGGKWRASFVQPFDPTDTP